MVFLGVALIVGSLSATGLIGLALVVAFDYVARHLRHGRPGPTDHDGAQ